MFETITDSLLSNFKDGSLKSILSSIMPEVLSFFWCVILAFVIWYIGLKIGGIFRRGTERSLKRHNAEVGVIQFVDSILKYLVYIILIILILQLFGVTAASISAAIASAVVTAGLALQGSISNFAGGVLIMILHPFRVGDYIIEDTNKNEGTVTEINIFYTKLMTIDMRTIVIPNGTLANNSLTNVTKSDERMMDLLFSISYKDDIRTAKEVLRTMVLNEDRRIKEKDADVHIFVSALNNSSVDLGVRFYCKKDDYWPLRWKMLEHGKYALEEAGMTIPFNQIDVHVDKEQ